MVAKQSSLDFIEPWHCDNCGLFIYNVNKKGYPSPGATVGVTVKMAGKPMRVCSVCADMYVTIMDNNYLIDIHKKWIQDEAHKEKLKSGQKYLD